MHDVYAYGVIAPSTLVELSDEYPPAAGYAEIRAVHDSLGGEAAGSAYVLGRLGVPTKLGGTRLGGDAASLRVIELLTGVGVDCRAVTVGSDTQAVTEIVFAHGGDRTIFGTYRRMLEQQSWDPPNREDVRTSRIVCADPFFADESVALARWCQEDSKPLVTVDTPPNSEMAGIANVVILSEEYTSRTLGVADSSDVMTDYTAHCLGLVILTRGSRPLLYGRQSLPIETFEPFTVDARDTAGAGDSFRAGIIYGMLNGADDAGLVRLGSAVAAIVSQRVPGVLNSPTTDELEAFLQSHPA